MQTKAAENKKGYRYLEEKYTADIGFEAFAESLESLMVAAAEATMNIMVHDLSSIESRQHIDITVESESQEMLLFDFLQELIFYKDAHQLLLLASEIEIKETEEGFRLNCTAYGEEMDLGRHEMLVDVKAVTLHEFKVESTEEGWRAVVVLDI